MTHKELIDLTDDVRTNAKAAKAHADGGSQKEAIDSLRYIYHNIGRALGLQSYKSIERSDVEQRNLTSNL